MSLVQMTCTLSVEQGGAGTSQWAFGIAPASSFDQSTIDALAAGVRSFWSFTAAAYPDGLTISFGEPLAEFEEDGTLVKFWTPTTTPASVTGTNTGAYAAGTGYKLNIFTDEIANSRRIRGGVYLVPGGGSSFTSQGTVATDTKSLIVTGAVAVQTAAAAVDCNLGVWSRTHDTFASLSGIAVSDKPAVLGSRKR